MNAYDYDPGTGEYTGTVICQESPLEPGVFLLPAHATTIEPPAEEQDKARCFIGGAWKQVADHRGKTIYDTNDSRQTKQVSALGETPAGYVLTPPPDDVKHYQWDGETWNEFVPPATLEDYDRVMENHLRAEREARGYTVREPSDYAGSSVARWAQDAADWIAHRDAVMLYGLAVIDHYQETGEAPTLEEFRAALPVITWTYTYKENEA